MATKTVYVELVAQTRKLNDGLKKADRQIGRTTQGLKKMAGALAGIFAVRNVTQAIKGTILDADELIKMARATGLSATEYERLAFVLKQLGATPTTLKQGLGDLQLRLGDVGKLYDKFFRQIGLDPDKLRNTSPAQQIELVLSALTKVENQAQRAAIAGRVLGEESSRQLLKVINAGATAIEDAAHGFIPSLASKEQEDQIEAMVNAAGELEQAWKAFKTQVVLSAGPEGLEAVNKKMGDIGETLGEMIRDQDKIIERTKWWATAIQDVWSWTNPIGFLSNQMNVILGFITGHWDKIVVLAERAWGWIEKITKGLPSADSILGGLGKVGGSYFFGKGFSEAQHATVPLAPRALMPFDRGVQQHIRQDIAVMAQGITWEQVKAAVRSEGGVAAKGGLR